jgi:hypothetical protein
MLKTGGMKAVIQMMRASAAPKHGKFSVVTLKQISKALTGMGKTVTGVEHHPDGSFTVMASDPEKQDIVTASYWDKVLPK